MSHGQPNQSDGGAGGGGATTENVQASSSHWRQCTKYFLEFEQALIDTDIN